MLIYALQRHGENREQARLIGIDTEKERQRVAMAKRPNIHVAEYLFATTPVVYVRYFLSRSSFSRGTSLLLLFASCFIHYIRVRARNVST